MATYDYRCEACGKRFSRTEKMSEHTAKKPACPKCKSRKVEQRFSTFFAKTARKS